MYSCPAQTNKAIPPEFRKIALELFPPGGFAPGEGPSLEEARAFAGILGIEEDYRKVLSVPVSDPRIDGLLLSFQNNLELLIQKTWVDKGDEIRKEKLLDRVPILTGDIQRGNLRKALEDFGGILEELASLFFGLQSEKDDFAEYAFRIDPQIGLFWWYGGQIACPGVKNWMKAADSRCLMALLLLGICYLTDF
jgi:hypothetical protein